jgi:hypothetical protein
VPAFSNSNKYDIIQNVDLMHRRLKAVTGKKLKHEDFIQLFVPEHQRQTFREIAPLVNNRAYATNVKRPDGTELRFRLEEVPHSASSPPPPPRLMVLQPDAPAELVESINEWIDKAAT